MENTLNTIHLKPGRMALILGILAIILVALSLTGQSFRFFTLPFELHTATGEFFLDMFIDEFSVNTESNIPTWFNATLLLLASLATFVIASIKRTARDRYRFEWAILACVFLLLSVDEASMIHEQFSRLFKDAPDVSGWLHYKWLIPGSIVVLLLALTFLRFFLHLESRYKILFLASSALYIFGAFGGELFSGHFANAYGTKHFAYAAMTTGEELLEWLGVILMIFTLLKYIETHFAEIQVRSGPRETQPVK